MKPKTNLIFLLLAFFAVLLTTCEKPARDNPWDELNKLNPEDWGPQNFQIEDVSIAEKKLTWEYTGDGRIEGFKFDRKEGNDPLQTAWQTLPKDSCTFTDTDITPGSGLSYTYKIYAYAGNFTSAEKSVTTSAEIPAPTNLQLEKLTDISYRLTWQDNSTGEEGFKIDRKIAENEWVIGYESVGENTTSFVDSNVFVVKSSINVQYRVYAFYKEFESSKTDANTNAALTPPSNLTITQNTITSITLNWQVNSIGEEGFRIERKQGTGNWELLTALTGTSYTDESFTLNTDVFYRIAAYFGQYYSDFDESSFNSQIPPPQNLTITANSATSITLNWSYNLTGHEGFKVERKIDNGSWEMLDDNLNPVQNSFTDDGLDLPQHDYTYRIAAFLSGFQSNYIEGAAQCVLSIGEIYKGGIIFYLNSNGGGLVCAESDQSTGARWGCYGTSPGGTGTGVGTGAANTAVIVAGCSQSGIAACICNDLVLNGYNDWFLPSKDELNLMYENLKLAGIGDFSARNYWNSSEYCSRNAWWQYFENGNQITYNKNNLSRVRCVRAF
jgi:hypothetical protein